MFHNLAGYLLNALEEHERESMQRFLQSDADADRAVKMLQTRFAWLESAREEQAPPPELAIRTCHYVRTAIEERGVS